jgi:hypothetical protein
VALPGIISLGNWKSKNLLHSEMRPLSFVLKFFIRNRVAVKSRECRSAFLYLHSSEAYDSEGRHLDLIKCTTTSSLTDNPILQRMAVTERRNDFLATEYNHLNLADAAIKMPRYRTSFTQGTNIAV